MGVSWGGSRAEPTRLEAGIARDLDRLHPGLDYWLHNDPDGTPWMVVSLDITRGGGIIAVPRIDLDLNGARGGLSPAMLNWWILRSHKAAVPLCGEPVVRYWLGHYDGMRGPWGVGGGLWARPQRLFTAGR